jgi:hypothetical protein
MNHIYLRITDSRLWILDYNFVCGTFFIPLTVYACVKLKKNRSERISRRVARRIAREELRRQRHLKKLQRLYKILKIAGSVQASVVFFQILRLRAGGDSVVVPGIDNCIDLYMPSYVDDERILRFLNDRFRHLAINGIIYITKEALCYLVQKEGLVDFPIVFLERVKIDGVYTFVKTFLQWGAWSGGAMAAFAGLVSPHLAFVFSGFLWLYIHNIKIVAPKVKEVQKLTGKFVPRISTRKDAIAFDAKEELPPIIEDSKKIVRMDTLDTEYEITESRLVDVSTVSGLKNKFSDRRFKRRKTSKTVYFIDKLREWRKGGDDGSCGSNAISSGSRSIDDMIQDGII